ncbi:SDR family oxidoreductase [archaeon]|jgi:dTDP-4-dehydrorhamnose reductase|nr:SDR family oxidoreductase [archaeon]
MKILILGARGLLGSNLSLLYSKNHDVLAAGKNKPNFTFTKNYVVDISKEEDLEIIEREKPDFVINCVALTNVDFCEENFELSREINALAAEKIAKACKKENSYFVHISTDAVFDGNKGNYKETDSVNPINVYGETKLEAEKLIETVGGRYSIVRTNIYGWNHLEKFSLAEWMLNKLRKMEKIHAFSDIHSSPINVINLGRAIMELFEKKYQGVIHISGAETSSKFNFAKKIAKIFNLNDKLIIESSSDTMNFKAKRGKNLGLNVDFAKNLLETKLFGIEEGLKELKEEEESDFLKKLKNRRFKNYQ